MPTQNDYKDAVKVAKQFGSLASVLEQLGDLDSASDAIGRRVDELKASETQIISHIAKMRGDVEELSRKIQSDKAAAAAEIAAQKAAADDVVKKQRASGNDDLIKARAQAARIEADANAKAAEIVADAKAEAAKHDDLTAERKRTLADLDRQVKSLQNVRDGLKAQLKAAAD